VLHDHERCIVAEAAIMCYMTVKGALWQKLQFSKTCSKQRSLSITGNFKKLTLDIKVT